MKVYLASIGAGLLVGVVYSLLNVRSPAPPVVALLGLLGILLGEQIVPLARRVFAGHPISVSVIMEDSRNHLFGHLPSRAAKPADEA
ncbi:DUF1427 family protein [Rhodovarius crocodyli]|uniref:DUF1427 family protein n=1 Tax=Rhodovarius crocodyli TaxID=1979269 RepID=A0A437MJB6_9PROT|nr:DUF1427 family protein [Rhodovarius crocodyli]RVT97758.1 DUF1427 family protein [Rhodovarius crocodyli]